MRTAMPTAIAHRSSLLDKGVLVWGGVIIALVALIFIFVGLAATGIVGNQSSLYKTVKDFETLIGAIVGFSGLAWSHFFAATHPGVRAGPPDSADGGGSE